MDDDPPPPLPPRGGGFGPALCRALGMWLAMGVAASHALLARKGGAPPLPRHDRQAGPPGGDRIETLQQLKERCDEALGRIGRGRSDVQEALRRLEGLDGGATAPPSNAVLPHAQRLLPLLADGGWVSKYRSTGSLREAFFRVRRELQDAKRLGGRAEPPVAGEKATASHPPNWAATNRFLRSLAESPAPEWSYLRPDCHQSSGTSGGIASDPSNATLDLRRLSEDPRVADLLRDVQEALNHRLDPDRDWCVGLESTEYRIEDAVEAYVLGAARSQLIAALAGARAALEAREAAANAAAARGDDREDAVDAGSCAQPSQVVAWIDAGLDAHYRRRDLRTALQDALGPDHPLGNASAAVPDLASTAALPGRPNRLTLRAALDTPLVTREAAHWADAAVERLEGRFEWLDKWVDAWYAEASAAAEASDAAGDDAVPTLGRLAVQRLLQAAGRLDDRRTEWSKERDGTL